MNDTTNILITGASGLVGSALSRKLDAGGPAWTALPHRDPGWNPEMGEVVPSRLEGHDTVVHLAGEPIAEKRWTDEQKRKIRDSRVNGTRALAETMARTPDRFRALICASAVGLYGDGGDKELTEESPAANDFLARVVQDWEAAADPARKAGIRVVHLRLGVVLSPDGGALAKMLPVFKLGLGGPIGTGKAWMSWIHVDDAAGAFLRAIRDPEMRGAYNLVSPHPVRNAAYTKSLGQALRRPAVLPVPPFALGLLLGEMAGALTQSARVLPERLRNEDWNPAFPELGSALRDLV